MLWIAPSEIAQHKAATEKSLSEGAVGLIAALSLFLCGCGTIPPQATSTVSYNVQELGVVTDVLPLVVQPDLTKWRQLKVGMTEADVAALMGNPYRKGARPIPDTEPGVIRLYGWTYGEITFSSFNARGSFDYTVTFHAGQVREIPDPWNGKFSPDGRPTVPQQVLPYAGQVYDHFPRFMDFRWYPASGGYPIEYEVDIQVMSVDQHEAEHYEDYIRKTIDRNRPEWVKAGQSKKEMDESAASFARHLRDEQGVQQTYHFRTHDIYLPFTWVGANTGRWRVWAVNDKGTSEWTPWRYFSFST